MRRNTVVAAVVLVVLSTVATVMVACSDSSSCKAGTVQLQLLLSGTPTLADTITVSSDDSFAMLSQSFPHTPGDDKQATLEITFPNGYPADKVLHLIVRAMGGVTVLGANGASIHLDPTCTTGHISINGNALQDAATSD